MIDPGHPFSVPYKELIDSLEDHIRNGVEQPDQARFIFQRGITAYELPRIAYAISRISGRRGSIFTIFEAGTHYRFSNNRIIWIHPDEFPNEGSKFEVEYTYRERPAGLTDFNPGSVTGTLIRAVAREMKLIYEQMDQAYRRAFIDQATGVALDNVVALLGVIRNPAIKATGYVTFFRKTETTRDVTIPIHTRVADESGRTFVTTEACNIAAEAFEFRVLSDGLLKLTHKIAKLVGIWQREDDPNTTDPLVTQDTPRLAIGEDERTIILPSEIRPAGELQIRYKPKSVSVPIEATDPGPEGNVNAGSIVIMPTPPSGVDGVVNEVPISGGQYAEPDDQLRERAKHALERSGNATLNAIKFAVLDVDGVEGVEVVDHSLDDTIPLGEVRVRYSGGDANEVLRVVEQTRAAGIMARLEMINEVQVSGVFYIIPDMSVPAAAADTFLSAVIEAIEALSIGQSLSLRRLNALVYQVAGLADTAEIQLRYKKKDPENPDNFLEGDVTDPLLIQRTELIRPDKTNLHVRLLESLKARRKERSKLDIELWLEDTAGNPVTFDKFSIDLSVTLRAFSKTALDQPPERIGRFTITITFVAASIKILTINPADPNINFRSEDHDHEVQVAISAAAFSSLKPVEDATVDFSS